MAHVYFVYVWGDIPEGITDLRDVPGHRIANTIEEIQEPEVGSYAMQVIGELDG